jgi:hypothetical protein
MLGRRSRFFEEVSGLVWAGVGWRGPKQVKMGGKFQHQKHHTLPKYLLYLPILLLVIYKS